MAPTPPQRIGAHGKGDPPTLQLGQGEGNPPWGGGGGAGRLLVRHGNDCIEREAPKMGAGGCPLPTGTEGEVEGGVLQHGSEDGDPRGEGGPGRQTRNRGRGNRGRGRAPPALTPTGLQGPGRRHSPRSSWPPSCPAAWRYVRSPPPLPSRRSPRRPVPGAGRGLVGGLPAAHHSPPVPQSGRAGCARGTTGTVVLRPPARLFPTGGGTTAPSMSRARPRPPPRGTMGAVVRPLRSRRPPP